MFILIFNFLSSSIGYGTSSSVIFVHQRPDLRYFLTRTIGQTKTFKSLPTLPLFSYPLFVGHSGKARSLLWQDQMCVVARQDLCCGKTRSLLWLDKTSVVARHKGGGLRPPPQRGAAFGRPPLWIPYVLPQQRSCLATAEILSCHSRDLVLPQHTHLVLPQQGSCLATF